MTNTPHRRPADPAAEPAWAAEAHAGGTDARIERRRRAYLRTRAKIRAVQERAHRGPLPPAAAAILAALCVEADRLLQEPRSPGGAAGLPDGSATSPS
jgi:hypothetical protein